MAGKSLPVGCKANPTPIYRPELEVRPKSAADLAGITDRPDDWHIGIGASGRDIVACMHRNSIHARFAVVTERAETTGAHDFVALSFGSCLGHAGISDQQFQELGRAALVRYWAPYQGGDAPPAHTLG
jgi:hypothetical protein